MEKVSMFGRKIRLMKPLQIQPGHEVLTFCCRSFKPESFR